LQERHVPCPIECPICDYHVKNDWHFLVDCSVSAEAINIVGLDNLLTGRVLHLRTTADLILDICCVRDREVAGRFAMVVWTLWNNRNNKVWNEEQDRGRRLGQKSHQQWLDWKIVQNFQQGSNNYEQQ
jgi:hypothetical protein